MKSTKQLFKTSLVAACAGMAFTAFGAVEDIERDLTMGSRGNDVVMLQTFLEDENYLTIPNGVPKGYFGPLTRSALAQYQSANGIIPSRGYFGPITRTYLDLRMLQNMVNQAQNNQNDSSTTDADMNNMPMSPRYMDEFDGASAVFFDEDRDMVWISSNTDMQIGMYNASDIDLMTTTSRAMDADGIYVDGEMIYQINRSTNRIDTYRWRNGSLDYVRSTSGGRFTNGRELAGNDQYLVVAQDSNPSNGGQNALFVFERNGGSALEYRGRYNVGINLWGIHPNGDDLHAVIDNSNDIAVFSDFFDMDASFGRTLNPTMTINVEGITRTHGLDYDADEDIMILTDIGSADSSTDGALHVIYDFSDAISDSNLSLSEQIRVDDRAYMLGNPVDVEVDTDSNRIYVAERAAKGGKLIVLDLPDKR